MDSTTLQELLDAVQAQNGGLVLKQGDTPQAVVLSVAKYQDLLANSKKKASGKEGETVTAGPKNEMRVLVTGGAGYLGSCVVRELLADSAKVVVLDNLSTGKKDHLPKEAVFVQGDVNDTALVTKVLKEHSINAITHLAAKLNTGEGEEDGAKHLKANLQGTCSVLESASSCGVGNFVFSSCYDIYGVQDKVPIPESANTAPRDPYGTSKLLAEQLVAYYTEFLGVRATVLRLFTVCGSVKEWGVKDTKEHHLLPRIVKTAKGQMEKVQVLGGDFATPDGSAIVDMVHVKDASRAFVLALKKLEGRNFKVYNVGTGKGWSVKEIINVFAEVTGRMIPMEISSRKAGSPAVNIADTRLAKEDLGFTAETLSLQDIITEIWEAEK